MSQSWFPPSPSWDEIDTLGDIWAEAPLTDIPQRAVVPENFLYTIPRDLDLRTCEYGSIPIPDTRDICDQSLPPINHLEVENGASYPPQPPTVPTVPTVPTHQRVNLSSSIPTPESTGELHVIPYNVNLYPKPDPAWNQHLTTKTTQTPHVAQPIPDSNAPRNASDTFVLNWSTSNPKSGTLSHSPSTAIPKRNHVSPEPATKKSRQNPSDGIDHYVVIFENSPGALANVKRRRKLEGAVRKAARDVRKAGACHQCRFRKRTCSTATPCGSCIKNGNGLHELKCQRESPFIGKPMHQYFEYSSTRRVVSFTVLIASNSFGSREELIAIDGIGQLSHPLQLRARRKPLSEFAVNEQEIIMRTEDMKAPKNPDGPNNDLESILILEDQENLAVQVEQWAVEYSSKFVHAAPPEFASTTMAIILGTAYVKKGLPESTLVAAMLRVASIAFVLRAGVKYTSVGLSPASHFRTIQATIDTILYQRLKLAERDLFQMLQRLVFRTAGNLNRQQIYPVALVLWQLLRILSLAASHLSNIVQRFRPQAQAQADYQFVALKLVLSTHLALFRSSSPLLLDFNDKLNQDLLGGDKHLLKLAMKMKTVVSTFREKGFTDMKGSIAYRKEYFEMFRKMYDGL